MRALPERWNELVAIPEHCWMTAALELNLLDLVTPGDWLLRLRVTHPEGLADYLSGRRVRPGCGCVWCFTTDGWTVLRITADRARRPRWVVRRVYALLRSAGYPGAPPDFGNQWRDLFE